jgi:hypothetical protein
MSAMPQVGDLAQEAEIVWLEDPTDLDYVRQALDKVNTRKGRPRYERDGRLIGYSTLASKAPAVRTAASLRAAPSTCFRTTGPTARTIRNAPTVWARLSKRSTRARSTSARSG